MGDRAIHPDRLHGTRYRTLRRLGRGGMGEVVVAEDTVLGRNVAAKILHRGGPDEEEQAADRLRVEARILAMFEHPNVVAVKDFGTTPEGSTYLVTELLDGRSLGVELRARRYLPVLEAVHTLIGVLVGLDAVHRKGVVHRDLKPDNIFLSDGRVGRTVKLLDFGIAKILWDDARGHVAPAHATKEGAFVGTPRYVAPEQLYGRTVDARTDLYAAGLVLYVAITGESPFAGCTNLMEQIERMEGGLPLLSSVAAQPIPSALDRLVARALAFLPEDRFQTAMELADALDEIVPLCEAVSDRGPDVTRVVVQHPLRRAATLAPAERGLSRQILALVAVTTALVLLCLLAAAWLVWGPR